MLQVLRKGEDWSFQSHDSGPQYEHPSRSLVTEYQVTNNSSLRAAISAYSESCSRDIVCVRRSSAPRTKVWLDRDLLGKLCIASFQPKCSVDQWVCGSLPRYKTSKNIVTGNYAGIAGNYAGMTGNYAGIGVGKNEKNMKNLLNHEADEFHHAVYSFLAPSRVHSWGILNLALALCKHSC